MSRSPLPIVFITPALRSALRDLRSAVQVRAGMSAVHDVAVEQIYALIAEIEKHDGAEEKRAAND